MTELVLTISGFRNSMCTGRLDLSFCSSTFLLVIFTVQWSASADKKCQASILFILASVFSMRFFTVCTDLSASPFDLAYVGDELECLNSHCSAKC